MKIKNNKKVLPFLIVILILVSSFAVIGAVSGAEMPTDSKATFSEGRILYVYGDNKTLADEWREYLTNLNYYVDLLPQDGLRNAKYTNYRMIIVGHDTNDLPYSEMRTMYRSNVPIIGIGDGGGKFSVVLGMTSHYYVSGSYTQTMLAGDIFIYNTPNVVSGAPGTVQLYSEPADHIFLLVNTERNANSTLFIGNWSGDNSYSPIVQINTYIYYGFIQSPAKLTASGDAFLQNVIYYMSSNHNYNLPIPRMISRINFDGQYSSYFEWYGASFVYVDSTGDNYTAMFQDEFYIYLYMHIPKTSDSDFMTVVFESNNSRNATPRDSTFYVLLSESRGGVKYREYNSSAGSWSSFKDPDGTNIDAKWVFGSSYYTAEIKISKAYMNLSKGSEQLLGYGIQYTNNINYPSTFKWYDPSTYITAYSQNHWNGQYEEISVPAHYAPTLDGLYDYTEWFGASSNYIEDSNGNSVYVRAMQDGTRLYLGGYITNVSGKSSTIYFYFDPLGNGGNSPQTDDFRIFGEKYSNDTFKWTQTYGTGTVWGSSEPLENATMRMTMKDSYVYYELSIDFSKLGIVKGNFNDIHLRVRSEIDNSYYAVPYGSSYLKPDDWTLILTSPSAWDVNYVTHDAHNGTAVTLDGVKNSGEWNDAFPYYYPVHGTAKYLAMYTKTHDNALYIFLHYNNPVNTTDALIELGFDVDYDHDGAPQSGDFVIEVNITGGSKEWYAHSGYWSETTPTGWSFAIDNSSSGWGIEIMIPYDKLNITPSEEKDIGIKLYLQDGYSIVQTQPIFASWLNTSGWSRITSSDNWGGNIEVPEFNTGIMAVLLIAVFVAMVGINRRRR